jgi:hypothetical protein
MDVSVETVVAGLLFYYFKTVQLILTDINPQ